MKRSIAFKPILLISLLLAGNFFTSIENAQCQGDIITLDLLSPTQPTQIDLNEKGYWTETYNTSEGYHWIQFENFMFSHLLGSFGGHDVGGGMSYWDGFTYCTSGDNTDHGETGSSDAWVAEQWGCMAGGGIKTDAAGNVMTDENGKVLVQKGNPYLVAYWGYWMETMEGGDPCLQVKFTDGKQYKPVGIYINNHPWPYYGNIHGDGFAEPFTEEGDFFKLIIHGLNAAGEDIGTTIEYVLAEFKDDQLHQSPDWEYIDLSKLGMVSGIYFTMETSDADLIVGPNTAVYFCLDKLQIRSVEETTAPTRPTGLTTIPSETTIDFSWTASSGTVGVKGYNLYLNSVFTVFTENTQHVFTNLQPYTQYQLQVEAIATNDSASEKASVSITTTDETAPTAPTNLTGTTTTYTMTLSWDAATDNVAVTEYHIYLNGERQKRVYTTEYTLTGLDADTEYLVELEARDAANNRSAKTGITLHTKILEDTTAPTRPTGLTTVPSETTIALSWTASTDNVAVTGYNVYLDNVLKGTTTETSFTVSNLTVVTEYKISIEAFDAGGNKSEKTTINVSTIDETAPTIPTVLAGTPTATSIALSWKTSSDNVTVTGYNIYVGDILNGTAIETNYTVTELTAATEYKISIEAFDAAGNKSEKATIAVTTSSATGISSVNKNPINVYPNPFNSFIILETTTNGEATIYDALGKLVLQVKTIIGTNQINTSGLGKGVYILKSGTITRTIIKR